MGTRMLLALVIWSGGSLFGAEPSLWFGKDDVPRLKSRVKAGTEAEVWRTALAQAEAWSTPGSPQFVKPEEVDKPPAAARVQVAGHYYGRRLTDWMETLGFAYQLTGEERFARQGVALLNTAVQKLPVTHPDIAPGFAGARGDIMRGLAVGHDWLAEAMTPDQQKLWAETASAYVRNIVTEVQGEKVWWRPYHNFMGVAIGAAGLLALELRDDYPEEAADWIRICANRVGEWLNQGFDEEGAYVEGTQYGFYGLSNAIRFADALKRNRGPDLFSRPRLRRVPWFYAMSLLPGEQVYEARNDANYAGAADPTLLRLAGAYDCGLAKWLWEQTGTGDSVFGIIWANDIKAAPPNDTEPLSQQFPGRGLCIWRTGWTAADVMFSVEAGSFHPVTHNQGDKGHFTLYGLAQRWAIDSGYGNNRLPGGRDSTEAHNCVLVDGKGQAPSGAGAGTDGRILDYESDARWGYACADASEAYHRNHGGKPGAGVRHARRHVAFARPAGGVPAYAVILDDIRKDDREHEYTWLLHFPKEMRVETRPDGAVITPESAFPQTYLETPVDAPGRGESLWEFEVQQTAELALWAQVRATGPQPSGSDSFFVEIDGEPRFDWHMRPTRDWSWDRVTRGVNRETANFTLEAGKHRLRLMTRETGAQVQQLRLISPYQEEPSMPKEKALTLTAGQARVTAPMLRTTAQGDPRAPRMRLWLGAASPIRYDIDRYDDHQRLKAVAKAVQPEFAAVLLPLPAGMPEPRFLVAAQPMALRFQLRWENRLDEWCWPVEGNRKPRFEAAETKR